MGIILTIIGFIVIGIVLFVLIGILGWGINILGYIGGFLGAGVAGCVGCLVKILFAIFAFYLAMAILQ